MLKRADRSELLAEVNWSAPPVNEISPPVPRASALPSESVPAWRSVLPVKVLAPVSETVPGPWLTSVPVPEITPP